MQNNFPSPIRTPLFVQLKTGYHLIVANNFAYSLVICKKSAEIGWQIVYCGSYAQIWTPRLVQAFDKTVAILQIASTVMIIVDMFIMYMERHSKWFIRRKFAYIKVIK